VRAHGGIVDVYGSHAYGMLGGVFRAGMVFEERQALKGR
jgi:hypothetical protein